MAFDRSISFTQWPPLTGAQKPGSSVAHRMHVKTVPGGIAAAGYAADGTRVGFGVWVCCTVLVWLHDPNWGQVQHESLPVWGSCMVN
jgi:hypothetical protein